MKSIIMFLLLCIPSIVQAKMKNEQLIRKTAAESESVSLVANYIEPLKAVSYRVRTLDQKYEFVLIQVLAEIHENTFDRKPGIDKSLKSFCLVLEVVIGEEDGMPRVMRIINHNDEKDVYIQECSINPTKQELTTLKQKNIWPIK